MKRKRTLVFLVELLLHGRKKKKKTTDQSGSIMGPDLFIWSWLVSVVARMWDLTPWSGVGLSPCSESVEFLAIVPPWNSLPLFFFFLQIFKFFVFLNLSFNFMYQEIWHWDHQSFKTNVTLHLTFHKNLEKWSK